MSQTATRVVTVEDADLRAAVAALLVSRGHPVTAEAIQFSFYHVARSAEQPDGLRLMALAKYAVEIAEPREIPT